MELYRKVRLACRDGMSERAPARHFGVSRQSVRKMLQFPVPPGSRSPKGTPIRSTLFHHRQRNVVNSPKLSHALLSSAAPSA